MPYLYHSWARPRQKQLVAGFQTAHAASVDLAQPGGHRAQYGSHMHGTPSAYTSISEEHVAHEHSPYLYVQEATTSSSCFQQHGQSFWDVDPAAQSEKQEPAAIIRLLQPCWLYSFWMQWAYRQKCSSKRSDWSYNTHLWTVESTEI